MSNLYQAGTFLSTGFCTISDITLVPNWDKNHPMKNFLREIRKSKGLTQEDLAERAGTTHPTVQRHENGKRRLTQEWLKRYSDALECHPSDITDGPGNLMAAQSDQEKNLLSLMRMMNDADQAKFMEMAEVFARPITRIEDKKDDRQRKNKS